MSPAEQLVGLLIECRRAGQPFATAWRTSLAQVQLPSDKKTCSEWRQALVFARREFEDAYENPGTPVDRLTQTLARDEATIGRLARENAALVLSEY